MSEIKKYLSLEGLSQYHGLIKGYIDTADGKLRTDLEGLQNLIEVLESKLGNWGSDNSDSDFVSVESAIVEINNLINEIRKEGGEIDTKIETAINEIVGDLREGESPLTLAQIAERFEGLGDVYAPKAEFEEVQKKVDEITSTGGEPNVQADWNTEDVTADSFIKNKPDLSVYATTEAVGNITDALESLKGDNETVVDAVNKIAADAANAALEEAKGYADGLNEAMDERVAALEEIDHDHENKDVLDGISAEKVAEWDAAEQNAKDYADSLVKDAEGKSLFDAAGSAEQALEDAKAYVDGKVDGKFDAAGAATTALEEAKEYADALVENEDGSIKFESAGAAAKALEDAQAYVDGKVDGKFDEKGAAAAAQSAAEATAAADATSKANAALADAKAYVVDNFDLKYDGNIIHIIGENGAKIGDGIDASAFITEGILKDVDFAFVDGSESDSDESNNTTLRLTFDTDKGDKVIDIDFKDYVDVYYGDGSSIELNSKTKTFSVKEVAADKTKLNSDITIAGGPLANNIAETGDEWPWTDDAGNKIIPQGKSMEEILTGLFLKVIDGTVSFGNVSWSPGVDKPTVTLSKSGTIEVGTKVKVTALNKGDFNKAKRSVTLTTTQGYFDGDTYSSDKTKKFYSAESTSSGTETISCTWNTVATDIAVNETELVAEEGTNTLIATQSGLTATVSAIPTKTVNASTNTKTKLTDTTPSKKQVATFTETQETFTSNTLSNSNSATVTAYYPIYTNGKAGKEGEASSETELVANDATKLALVADNTTFYVNFAPMIKNGTGYRLLVKSGKTIKEAMALNTLNSKYEVDMLSSFVKADGTVDKASGDKTFAYDVYEATGTAGANAIRFKID